MWHLYNIAADPGEVNDLRGQLPQRFVDMQRDYAEYARRNGVPPMPDGYDYKVRGQLYALKHVLLPRLRAASSDCIDTIVGAAGHDGRADAVPEGMVRSPGGDFLFGSASTLALPSEQPVFPVRMSGSWMDVIAVPNGQFDGFVRATGYITIAGRTSEWDSLRSPATGRHVVPSMRPTPGAMVFRGIAQPVLMDDWSRWWA